MSLPSYSAHRPGVTIKQTLVPSGETAASEVNACVVGPKFLLNRYGKETVPGTTFNSAGQTLTFQRMVSGVAEDLDLDAFAVNLPSLKLYGRNLEATLATFTAAGNPSFTVPVLSSPHIIKLSSGHVKGGSLSSGFRNRPVTVGDVVNVVSVNGGATFKRKVTGLLGVVAAGSFGTEGTDGDAGNVAANPTDSTASATQLSAPSGWSISCATPSAFNGLAGAKVGTQYGEDFTITVHTAGAPATATVNISSASGLYSATNVATVNSGGNFSITNSNASGALAGVTLLLTPPSGGLTVGMSFRIRIIGNYSRLSTTQVVAGGEYTGSVDTTYMVRVTGTNSGNTSFSDATVSITDTAGVDDPQYNVELTDNTAIDVGSHGLTIKFHGSGDMPDHAGLRVGDVYYIKAVAGAVSTTNFDRVVLDGPAIDTLTFTNAATELYSVEFRLPFTGEIASDAHSTGVAWTSDGTEMVVTSGAALYISSRSDGYKWCSFVTTIGELVPSYKAAYKVAAGEHALEQIALAEDLTAAAGASDLDNMFGYCAREQLIGAAGVPIFVLNTGGTAVEDYEAALAAIQASDQVYSLLILDASSDIRQAVQAHVQSASADSNMHYRRAVFGLDSPGSYAVLSKRSDTTNFTATVSPHGGGNKLVTIIDGADESALTSLGLVAGDLFKLGTAEYPIASVVSDTELLLSSGPDTAVDPAEACTIYKADTAESQIEWLRQQAVSMTDRRITLCWAERPTASVDGSVQVIPVVAGAARMTGIRAALPPQVGLTRQNIPTFTAAPSMYSKYTQAQLDTIAAYGICIFEQPTPASNVRVRHQATTDTSDILNYEESTTVRLDVLSARINVMLDALIGKVNTTDAAVELIRSQLISLLNTARQISTVGSPYGPLIDNYRLVNVRKSASFRDRIEVGVLVELGPPTNRIAVELNTYASIPAALLA